MGAADYIEKYGDVPCKLHVPLFAELTEPCKHLVSSKGTLQENVCISQELHLQSSSPIYLSSSDFLQFPFVVGTLAALLGTRPLNMGGR